MMPRSPLAGLCSAVLALLLLFPSLALPAVLNPTRPAIQSIARAYGFVTGQGIALDLIADGHPELAAQVALARESFDAAFPGVEVKLEDELRAIFGAQGFMKFRRDMLDKVIDAQIKQPKSAEQARSLLAEVQRRARGDGIEQDVLDYLLAALYGAEPAAEFADGFRQRFRTDGSGKAQGVRLRLQLPRSWRSSDSELPHVVQQWTSESGNGNAMIVLGIRDALGLTPSKGEIERFIAEGGARELAIGGGDIIDASSYALETLPGFSAVLRATTESDGQRRVTWTQLYQVFFRGKAIGVRCTAVGKEGDAAQVEQRLRRLQPLCRQVASSLMMEQIYD